MRSELKGCDPAMMTMHDDKITAIGDAVNLASRIEAANKHLETELLVSAETRALLGDRFRFEAKEGVTLPGKAGVHTLFEVCR